MTLSRKNDFGNTFNVSVFIVFVVTVVLSLIVISQTLTKFSQVMNTTSNDSLNFSASIEFLATVSPIIILLFFLWLDNHNQKELRREKRKSNRGNKKTSNKLSISAMGQMYK